VLTPRTSLTTRDDRHEATHEALTDDRVVFTSANDLHLSGMARFEGAVTASGDRANLMLSLGDQAPDGTVR